MGRKEGKANCKPVPEQGRRVGMEDIPGEGARQQGMGRKGKAGGMGAGRRWGQAVARGKDTWQHRWCGAECGHTRKAGQGARVRGKARWGRDGKKAHKVGRVGVYRNG